MLLLFFPVHFHCHNSILFRSFSQAYTRCTHVHVQCSHYVHIQHTCSSACLSVCLFVCVYETWTHIIFYSQYCQSKVSALVRAPSEMWTWRPEMDCANEDSVTWKKLKSSRKNENSLSFLLFAVSACACLSGECLYMYVYGTQKLPYTFVYKYDSLVYIHIIIIISSISKIENSKLALLVLRLVLLLPLLSYHYCPLSLSTNAFAWNEQCELKKWRQPRQQHSSRNSSSSSSTTLKSAGMRKICV